MKNSFIRLFPRIRKRRGDLETESQKGQRYCPNCHYPLPHYGEFCSNCGQRYTDGRVPLKFLVQDFIDNVLNIDSKVFRTTWALIKPGKLTIEFFKGHHKRYASPARLFFVATVVHFAVLGLLVNDKISSGLASTMEDSKRKAYERPLRNSLQEARDQVSALFPDQPVADQVLDSLFTRIESSKTDSHGINYPVLESGLNFTLKNVTVTNEDFFSKSPEELADENGITGKLERLVFQQAIKVETHSDNFGPFMLGQLVWMVILMMPALALILKLLYFRRNRYFVEHLVFSFHYHAFSFWVVSIMLVLMSLTNSWDREPLTGLVITAVIFGILIYLFLAMRRVYQQGFFKTFVKYTLLNFAYVMIFSLFLALTFAVSALVF